MRSGHFGQICQPQTSTKSLFSPLPRDNPDLKTGLWDLGASPIRVNSISNHLSRYPDRLAALALSEGLTKGFKLKYLGPRVPVYNKNLTSAHENPKVLQEKIDKEVSNGRIAGPFHTPSMHNLHILPVGVVSKADGGWRMIMHISCPPSISINLNRDPIHTTV